MLNRRKRSMALALAMSLAVTGLTSGCEVLKKQSVEPVSETQTEALAKTQTETQTESETQSEIQTETELQTNVVYVSQDKTIRITLPDSSWRVMQDVQEMRVFASGSDAMLNIVYAEDSDDMKNITVLESQDELETSLARQYPESDAFEVIFFEKKSSKTLDSYEYIVKYNSSASMWAYSITYGILAKDKAYVVSGTVTEDNEALLAAVQQSVESFSAPGNATFSVLPGQETETETESESESEADDGAEELTSLQVYGATATLYASGDQVNVREKPGMDAVVIDVLLKGQAVTVDGETTSWFRVNIGGNTGYVSKAFLVSSQPAETSAESETTADTQSQTDSSSSSDDSMMTAAELNNQVDYGTSYTYYTTDEVRLRAQPGTDSSVLDTVASGSSVTVIGETDNWFVVTINDMTGYISKAYVSSSDPGSGTAAETSASAESSAQTEASASTENSASSDSSDSTEASQTESASGTDNTGTDSSGTSDSDSSGTSDSDSGGTSDSASGSVSGTVTAATMSTVTILGTDGNTYTVDYSDASMSTGGGLTIGQTVTATIDYSGTAPDGTLYATSVTGQ